MTHRTAARSKGASLRVAALLLLALPLALLTPACQRDVDELGLEPPGFPVNPDVYRDGFSAGLEYAAFGGSVPTAFDVDTEVAYAGTSSMRIAVPDVGDPRGAYAGGAYFTTSPRDLSSFDVLTFWARASRAATIDVVGFGNDLGANANVVTVNGLPVTTNWEKYYIPIPDPARLTQERGMFFYSEGPEDGRGYTFWIDEVRFERLGTVGTPRGFLLGGRDSVVAAETGTTFQLAATVRANLPNGVDQEVTAAPAYFSYLSSNPSVASVSPAGLVTVLDSGTATITALLGDEPAEGSLTVASTGAAVLPLQAAPTPTLPADDVISVFSDAYADVPVDFFNGYWQFSTAETFDVSVGGDAVKRYTNLNFVGIQFTDPTIDASAMTHFRMDVWTPQDVTAATEFKVLLVDVGADLTFGTTDDSSHEVTIPGNQLASRAWVTLDLPLADFPGLASREHLAQIVLSGDLSTVFVDNILFYDDGQGGGGGGSGGGTEPTVAAPTPTRPAAGVISLFSDAYQDVEVDTWRTDWSSATLADVTVAGDAVKRYTELDFVGIETVMSQIDATGMTHFHFDAWTPDATLLGVKLVDFGADGAFDGGDDVEFQLDFASPPQGEWVSYDLPLSDFADLTTRANLAQLIFVAQPSGAATLFVDNVYFYDENAGGGGTEPTGAAPTPTQPAGDVISLFSDAYADVGVDTWRTDWSSATLEDVTVAGDAVKKYTELDFVGIETTGANLVDATAMTTLHLDVWSPDFTLFGVKLVDFGADGGFEGGDDSEFQVDFRDLPTGRWVSLDIPLADFTGLQARSNLAQLILVGQPTAATTVYVDNVYFYR